MSIHLVCTEDGSLSCLDEQTGELFHNRAGAFTEALQNYVEPSQALELFRQKGRLTVLDACFGLGYNSWVLLAQLMNQDSPKGTVEIIAIEVDEAVLDPAFKVLELGKLNGVKKALNHLPGLSFGTIKSKHRELEVGIEIKQGCLRKIVPGLDQPIDLVFHDPFSPRKMPELWTEDLFNHYYRLLSAKAGRLLTYSSAAAVRRGLIQSGFKVYRTSAVGAKSGGTLAAVNEIDCEEGVFILTSREFKSINSPAGLPYRDPTLSASRQDIVSGRNGQ